MSNILQTHSELEHVKKNWIDKKCLIGSDPELLLLNSSGRVVGAENYINDHNHNLEIGLDGLRTVMEIRPRPAYTSAEHKTD